MLCTPDSGLQGLFDNRFEELSFVGRPDFIGGSTIELYRLGTLEYDGFDSVSARRLVSCRIRTT
jgi:hypothetical protein